MLQRLARTEPQKIDPDRVMREWLVPCDDCGHSGAVRATIIQIRRWVREEKLICTACGCVKQSFRST